MCFNKNGGIWLQAFLLGWSLVMELNTWSHNDKLVIFVREINLSSRVCVCAVFVLVCV